MRIPAPARAGIAALTLAIGLSAATGTAAADPAPADVFDRAEFLGTGSANASGSSSGSYDALRGAGIPGAEVVVWIDAILTYYVRGGGPCSPSAVVCGPIG